MTAPTNPSGSHAAGPSETGRPDVEGVSVGALISEVTEDLSTLMRQELELAKAEVKQEATKSGKAAGMLGAAGYAAHFLMLFLSLTLMWALGDLFGHWGWGALVVAVLWGIAAAVLASMGRKKLREVHPKPERTVDTLKEVPSALKGR